MCVHGNLIQILARIHFKAVNIAFRAIASSIQQEDDEALTSHKIQTATWRKRYRLSSLSTSSSTAIPQTNLPEALPMPIHHHAFSSTVSNNNKTKSPTIRPLLPQQPASSLSPSKRRRVNELHVVPSVAEDDERVNINVNSSPSGFEEGPSKPPSDDYLASIVPRMSPTLRLQPGDKLYFYDLCFDRPVQVTTTITL